MPSFTRTTALLPILIANQALAVDLSMSPQGYTGLSITPSAHLLGWGDMGLAYDRQLPGAPDPDGHNFIVGFGLLPHLEMTGRIASNTMHCNLYTNRECGIRDLSANFKAGIGLDDDSDFGLAIGGTDLGGAATRFRSYYGVATYDPGNYQVSVGYARRTDTGASRGQTPLDGPFASLAYQPFQWLQGHVEYSDKNAYAGARLFTPIEWLPRGWVAYAGVNARLTSDTATKRAWWSLGMTVPLYQVPFSPANRKQVVPTVALAAAAATAPSSERTSSAVVAAPLAGSTSARGVEPKASAPAVGSSPSATPLNGAIPATSPTQMTSPAQRPALLDSHLRSLATNLKAKGLEDISVGRLPDGSIAVAVNNATYNWNTLDAVGVSLGVVARELAFSGAKYRLIVTQRQIPVVALSGESICLKQWIAGGDIDCTAAELFTPGMTALEPLHDGASWVVRNASPSWQTLRIGLQPVMNTNVATEYGVFDYSLGLGVTLTQPLWRGGTADFRYIGPLDNSSDFERTGVYGSGRLKEGLERALITHTFRLPLERWMGSDRQAKYAQWGPSALTAQVSAGRAGVYNGVYGEMRWEPGEGIHRVTVEGGRFRHRDRIVAPSSRTAFREQQNARPVLTTYRYHHLPTETFFEVTGGQFLNHDRGWQFVLRQWFSDTALALYYKRTRFDYQPQSAAFAGLEVSFPLGPRKEMSPGSFVQVRGTPRWSYAVETLTGRDNNNITIGHAVRPGLSAFNFMFNSDRAGVAYYENNISRIRDAAR